MTLGKRTKTVTILLQGYAPLCLLSSYLHESSILRQLQQEGWRISRATSIAQSSGWMWFRLPTLPLLSQVPWPLGHCLKVPEWDAWVVGVQRVWRQHFPLAACKQFPSHCLHDSKVQAATSWENGKATYLPRAEQVTLQRQDVYFLAK